MDRIFPWYVGSGRHPFLGWIGVTLFNAVTLATYVAAVLTAVLLVWRALA